MVNNLNINLNIKHQLKHPPQKKNYKDVRKRFFFKLMDKGVFGTTIGNVKT